MKEWLPLFFGRFGGEKANADEEQQRTDEGRIDSRDAQRLMALYLVDYFPNYGDAHAPQYIQDASGDSGSFPEEHSHERRCDSRPVDCVGRIGGIQNTRKKGYERKGDEAEYDDDDP